MDDYYFTIALIWNDDKLARAWEAEIWAMEGEYVDYLYLEWAAEFYF